MVWHDQVSGLEHDVASADSQTWWAIVCRTDEPRREDRLVQRIVHVNALSFGVVTCLKCLTHVTR